ncbi:MAG: ECF-type sigma factor [Micromonosporaceae bacterium]
MTGTRRRAVSLRRWSGDHSLRTTAWVHEAYLRLPGHEQVTARGRSYFFGAAARAMRQVIIDRARRRRAAWPRLVVTCTSFCAPVVDCHGHGPPTCCCVLVS